MAQNNNDGVSDQKRSLQKAKQSVNNIKKQYNKATKPIQDAKRQAKSYGKSQAKKAAKKGAKKAANKAGEVAKKAGQKAAEVAKNVAQKAAQAIAKAAKAIGKAVVEALKDIAQGIASLGPYGWIVLAIIVVLLCCYGAAVYNSEKISKWLIGESTVDLSVFNSQYADQAEKILEELKRTDSDIAIGNDLPMMAKEDVIKILEHVVKYNRDMTTKVVAGCQYDEYETFWDPLIIESDSYSTKIYEDLYASYTDEDMYNDTLTMHQYLENKKSMLSSNSSSGWHSGYDINELKSGVLNDVGVMEMSYGQIAYLDVEGTEAENYYSGVYEVDWRVVLVLCEMMTEANSGKYGTISSEWTEEQQQALNTNEYFETSMNGYFISDEQIDALCQLLDYNVDCYPDNQGFDYVKLGLKKLEEGDTYEYLKHISITWTNGIEKDDVDYLAFAYEPDVVRTMTYTLYPTKDIYGNEVKKSSGIVYNNPNHDGEWTYIAPFNTGYVFDTDAENPLIVNANGDYAVKYIMCDVGDTSYHVIVNNDEMLNYKAYEDLRVPYIAPRRISNVFFTAEYNYIDIPEDSEYYIDESGAKMLDTITLTIDAQDFYNRLNELIPGFSFEHFYELYSYFKVDIDAEQDTETVANNKNIINEGIDSEINRWKKMEELYKKGKEAADEYDTAILSGVGTTRYGSRDDALSESKIVITLDKSAMGDPTNGLIFIGDNSVSRASAGYNVTDTSYIWIGAFNEQHIYNGYYDIYATSKRNINQADAYLNKDDEKVAVRKMCNELYQQMYDYGKAMYNIDDQNWPEDNWYFNLMGTESRYQGGPFWCHFRWGSKQGDINDANTKPAPDEFKNEELVDHLIQWQHDNPDKSLSAGLAIIATCAYLDNDPWMVIWKDTIETGTTGTIGTFYSEATKWGMTFNDNYDGHNYGSNCTSEDMYYFFIELDKLLDEAFNPTYYGQYSFYDMEFGNGFSNTAVSQGLYKADEERYTYGGRNNYRDNGIVCPWWLDPLFPTNSGGVELLASGNKGWCNFAGTLREATLQAAGYTSMSLCKWPLMYNLGEGSGLFGNSFTTTISSPYGYRKMSSIRFHYGIDICVDYETPVVAVVNGTLYNFGECGDAGYMITLVGDDGYIYKYMHLTTNSTRDLGFTKGDRVTEGTIIGLSGNTGGSQGPHLHFQIEEPGYPNNKYIDPAVVWGIDESNQYWRTHRRYYTESDCEKALETGDYRDLH